MLPVRRALSGLPSRLSGSRWHLIPKAGEDLQRLQERTSLSKTDITNRAITLYEFIDAQLRAGRDVLIRDGKTGETQLVRIL